MNIKILKGMSSYFLSTLPEIIISAEPQQFRINKKESSLLNSLNVISEPLVGIERLFYIQEVI